MAIQCLICGYIFPGEGSLHLASKCDKCGNSDRDKFFRVDDEDIDPKKYEADKEWLEAHKRDEEASEDGE